MTNHAKSFQHRAETNRYSNPAVISTLNHELRNPLTVIASYSQLLERRARKAGDEQAVSSAQVIIQKTQLLTEMIAAVTDVMKIEAGTFVFKDEQVYIRQEVQLLIDELNQQQVTPVIELVFLSDEENGVSKVRSAAGGAHPPKAVLTIDPIRFRQALKAIILNALQFSPEADKIVVSVVEKHDLVVIVVRDWGVGIPENAMSEVANAYYRGDASHPLQKPGLGLGLFIATHIVNHYKGTLNIVSTNSTSSLRNASSKKQNSEQLADPETSLDKGTAVTMSFPKKG